MANLNIYDDLVAGGAVVELAAGGGDQLILAGIAASDLNHQDFVFV